LCNQQQVLKEEQADPGSQWFEPVAQKAAVAHFALQLLLTVRQPVRLES
jgi:hypothetical protein